MRTYPGAAELVAGAFDGVNHEFAADERSRLGAIKLRNAGYDFDNLLTEFRVFLASKEKTQAQRELEISKARQYLVPEVGTKDVRKDQA
jgi:hypothetical protein